MRREVRLGERVFLAPVPASILASALTVPGLSSRVAFGSNKESLGDVAVGLPVLIYVSEPPHALHVAGMVTWAGTLGAIVPAARTGKRSGKHPDVTVRPPFAESGDTPAMWFWEVLGLHPMATALPLGRLRGINGSKPFEGRAPRWPTIAEIVA